MTDIKDQLKKLEVFADGRLVREWEPVALGDFPPFIVLSKTDTLLWGRELLQAIVNSQANVPVETLFGADRVVAEWMDGRIEVMTDDETKVFTSREGWQTYWRSSDEWLKEIDDEGAAK